MGAQYTSLMTAPNRVLLDVSANLIQAQDVALSGAATPSSITTGAASEYALTVMNGGPGNGPITFTDTVPAGLQILSAAAGSGTCTTAGQAVTCTITGLGSGATAPVLIIVSAANAGSYPDTATVAPASGDPNLTNNSATVTLAVSAPVLAPPPSCHVVSLAGAPLAVAKAVIPALNCTIGKVTKKASKKVPKGYVVSTSPGPGTTIAAGATVKIVVSSGPPKKKKKKKM